LLPNRLPGYASELGNLGIGSQAADQQMLRRALSGFTIANHCFAHNGEPNTPFIATG